MKQPPDFKSECLAELQKNWLKINLSLVLFLFFFTFMSFVIFFFFDFNDYLEDGFLWFTAAIYMAIWLSIAYQFGIKKKGEISILIHLLMLSLNSLALIVIFSQEMIDFAHILLTTNLKAVYLFILSQYYISFAILIIIFLNATEVTYRLYKANRSISFQKLNLN